MSSESPSLTKEKFPLRGVIPPLVTPLRDRDALDIKGLERLVEHVTGGGVHGLFVLGTTGEGPALSYPLRRELITRVCEQVADRIPVLVGITDTSFTESVKLAAFAAEQRAAGVVAAPPYYFPCGQAELIEYFEHLTQQIPLPLYLYNMPTHTKTVFEIPTVQELANLPGLAGIKDSSANMIYFQQLLALRSVRPDWTFLVGPEELLGESLLMGGDGGVCGGANLFPKLYVGLYEAARAKDVDRVTALHARVMQISNTLYRTGRHGSSFLKSLKCALRETGICDDFMAEPFHRFRDSERALVRKCLEELQASE